MSDGITLTEPQALALQALRRHGPIAQPDLERLGVSHVAMRSLVRKGIAHKRMISTQGEDGVRHTYPRWSLTAPQFP